MKNFMKKIIVGIFALAFILTANYAFASTWNGDVDDCPLGLAVGNATTGVGVQNGQYGCWTLSSVSATAGQTISVAIYYDNTSGVNQNNVRAIINQLTSGASFTHQFSGSLTSTPGGNFSLGSATVNLSSAQTLTFSSIKWYPNNQNTTAYSLLNGQSGSEVVTAGGLNIGTIVPTLPTSSTLVGQGSIIVNFTVGQAQISNCTISNFTVNNSSTTTIVTGQSSTLSWNTANCTDVTIYPTLGNVNSSGTQSVSPTSPMIYTLSGYSSNTGTISRTVTVNVSPVIPQTCQDPNANNYGGALPCTYPVTEQCTISNFNANSSYITSGQGSILSWNTNGCTNASISTLRAVPVDGSRIVYPTNTTTYVLRAYGANWIDQTRSITVTVSPVIPQTCRDQNANNYGGALPCTYPVTEQCTISNFTGNGSQNVAIQSGGSVNLVWHTNNCTSASVVGPSMYSNNLDGNQNIYPTNSGTYTITAYGNTGGAQTQTAYVYVGNTNYNYCTISNFTANPNSITSGQPVTLSWNTNNCTSASVVGPSMYSNNLDGNQNIYPTNSGTYTITAYGNTGGAQTQTAYVYVGNTNYNYCTISNFTANPNSITSGQPVTLSWNTNNCTSVSISGIGSNLPHSGNQVVYPSYTTTYTLNAYGNNRSPSQAVAVNVRNILPPPVYNACAVTTVASNMTRNSAQLNGLITNNNVNTNSYFEYGTTVHLGSRTNSKTVNGSYFETISGLSADTIYYFRSVANCGGVLAYGTIEIFVTEANQSATPTRPVRPIIIQGATVVGTSSPIMLKIENKYQSIGVGDIIDYTVTYKNIGKSLLTKPIVQVIVPRGITITNSSAGTYSTDTNTLTTPIYDLRPGDEGVIYLQGYVNSLSSNTAQVVTTAVLVYTNPSGAQENAIAYVLNNPREVLVNSNLGAAAGFLGIFPTTLLGWLLLLLLILIIVLVTRRYYRKSTVLVTTPGGATTSTTHY